MKTGLAQSIRHELAHRLRYSVIHVHLNVDKEEGHFNN